MTEHEILTKILELIYNDKFLVECITKYAHKGSLSSSVKLKVTDKLYDIMLAFYEIHGIDSSDLRDEMEKLVDEIFVGPSEKGH